MTLRTRRIIYLTFILLFLLITPAVFLYAAGYRYNFKKNKIQKTGILILKSYPKDATIYLNGKIIKEKTPAKIINLLPDEYFIKIEKENFYPWQKKLTIESKLTTFAENVILFKKNLPIEIKNGSINFISLSPDKQKLAFALDLEHVNEVWILTLKEKKEKLIYRTSNQNSINTLEWSPTSKEILVTISTSKEEKKYLVFDVENPQKIEIYNELKNFYSKFKKIEEKKLTDNYVGYDLIESPNQLITLVNPETQSLIILDQNNEVILETEARGGEWFSDGKKLLYFNNFELWTYDLILDQKKLVTRQSENILDAKWYLNDNYVIFQTNDSVKVIELDQRDIKNVINLVKMDEIYKFEINKKEEKIYLLGKIGEKIGIYELELK